MRRLQYCWTIIASILFTGCDTPQKLQRNFGFSDTCRESYKFFLERIERQDKGLIEFIEPVAETYEELLSEHYKNVGGCWSDVLPEKGVLKLFGEPHRREVGKKSGDITMTYFIRSKQCMNLDELNRPDEKCGNLIFSFSKEGKPKGSIFYALGATRKE